MKQTQTGRSNKKNKGDTERIISRYRGRDKRRKENKKNKGKEMKGKE
jgi:hypothetical protein